MAKINDRFFCHFTLFQSSPNLLIYSKKTKKKVLGLGFFSPAYIINIIDNAQLTIDN